ncbi:MAG TPA: pirin family protein [bacterium]|nr:pirin family protein [bacterium]
MPDSAVLSVQPLGFPWQTQDPFLVCVYHQDAYPAGNAQLGPAASLAGRNLGMDFEGKDGWRMYHGLTVPGFPRHPHRGFETVTLVRRGLIDHTDSLGAAARFGGGDVQWVTAGKGVEHAEMFPLLDPAGPNPLELFQIWLNLPRADKLVEPHFKMLWRNQIPTVTARDAAGRETAVTLVAGAWGEVRPPAPPPGSWAARAESDVAIWTLKLSPQARWVLPAARPGTQRTLYFFRGAGLQVGGQALGGPGAVRVRGEVDVSLINGAQESELLLLQGRPIGEPVVQHGPFVMNSRSEIVQAFQDYQQTEFGGWPWPSDGPVHPAQAGRHARYPDGRVEQAP